MCGYYAPKWSEYRYNFRFCSDDFKQARAMHLCGAKGKRTIGVNARRMQRLQSLQIIIRCNGCRRWRRELALILARYHNINLHDEMWTSERWKNTHNGTVTSNYQYACGQHNKIAEMKKKRKRKNNVHINGQNREDAYCAPRETDWKKRESVVHTLTPPELREMNLMERKKDRKKKWLEAFILFCFMQRFRLVPIWCWLLWYGWRDRLSIRIAFYMRVIKRRAKQESQTEKVKEIAGAYLDRINRIWSGREVDRTRNSSKWSSNVVDEMRENSHDRREFVCRQRSRWRRRRLNYYAFNNKAPQIKENGQKCSELVRAR